jgi:putative ABC transport system substrate-binding protein
MFLAIGTRAAAFLHKRLPGDATLVYCMVSGPQVAKLRQRPKTHGISTEVPLPEQFGFIASALPEVRSVGMLYSSGRQSSHRHMEKVRQELPAGWVLYAVDVDRHASMAKALAALLARKPAVVWTAADPAVYNAASIRALLLGALRRRTPVFGFSVPFVRAGALLGVGVDPEKQGQQAATYCRALLAGQTPPDARDGSTHSAAGLRWAANLIVAKQIGIELPPQVVRKADIVFKTPVEADSP